MLERTVRTLHMLEKDKKSPIDRIVILNKEIAQVACQQPTTEVVGMRNG